MRSVEYSESSRRVLLKLGRDSIAHGLATGEPASVADLLPVPELAQTRASFVTLRQSDELRGCMGSLEATLPLAESVARNAYQSAFEDPRFLPLRGEALATIAIEISVLSTLEAMKIHSEADLLTQLEPLVDGVVLAAGPRRSTFLPKVWEQLPDPQEFVHALKRKAGLEGEYWSSDIRIYRYHTETFAESEVPQGSQC